MVDAILADRGGLARLHRLEELSGIGTADFRGLRRIRAVAARGRHASTSGGRLEDLIARRVDLGGHGCTNRGNQQQSDGEHESAHHVWNLRSISQWSGHGGSATKMTGLPDHPRFESYCVQG